MINSNKYGSQSDQLEAALNEKCPLVNRKCVILHQDNGRLHVFPWSSSKNILKNSLTRKFWFIHCNHQVWHLWISIYFDLYKSLNGENFNSLGDWKRPLEEFFAQKDKTVWGRWIYGVAWKTAEVSRTERCIHCLIKFFMKMKNASYFFTFKKEYFGWLNT